MNRAEALRIVLRHCGGSCAENVRLAVAVLTPRDKPKNGVVSERGMTFAQWFRVTLAADANLPANWCRDWARIFDEMIALDGRTPEQIAAVCKWARGHDFWRQHFLTPAKLRKRKDGVMYFDKFSEAMKAAPGGPARRTQTRGYEIAAESIPRAESASEILAREGR